MLAHVLVRAASTYSRGIASYDGEGLKAAGGIKEVEGRPKVCTQTREGRVIRGRPVARPRGSGGGKQRGGG